MDLVRASRGRCLPGLRGRQCWGVDGLEDIRTRLPGGDRSGQLEPRTCELDEDRRGEECEAESSACDQDCIQACTHWWFEVKVCVDASGSDVGLYYLP